VSLEFVLRRRAIRVGQLCEKTGLSESSIWRLVRLRQFPQPVKLSPGCTAWFEHEIDEWLDGKGSARENGSGA
jgi:prophage regulatory protein